MKTATLLLFMMSFFVGALFGQEKYEDKLILRDGNTVLCKILEVTNDEIRYAKLGTTGEASIVLGTDKIDKILYADGTEKRFEEKLDETELLKSQRINALKFNLLLPLAGASAFAYERSISKGKSFEIELGIINSGNSSPEMTMEADGMFLKTGMKFITIPAYFHPGAHLLDGLYLKPELAITSFRFDKSKVSAQLSSGPGDESGTVAKMAAMFHGGK